MDKIEQIRQLLTNQYTNNCNQSRDSVSLEITVTNACNCKCSYCFEETKNCSNSTEVRARQLSLLTDYCNNFDTVKFQQLDINFWGGEPLLDVNYILDIIEATKHFNFVYYYIYTNGTLIDNIKFLLSNYQFNLVKPRVEFQLSYDGSPHHEIKRGYSKDLIIATADLLHKNKVNFSFKATLTYDFVKHLPEIWDSYEQLYNRYGFNAVYNPSLDTTEKTISNQEYNDWKLALIEIAKREIKFFRKHKHPLWSWLKTTGPINCNRDYTIHLHNDGNAYICHGAPYSKHCKKLVIANIFDITSLDQIIINRGIQDSVQSPVCNKCSTIYCAKCHISLIKDLDKYSDWKLCQPHNSMTCLFYSYFSLISRLINFQLVNTISIKTN